MLTYNSLLDIFERMGVYSIILSDSNYIIEANESFCKRFEKNKSDILNNNLYSLFHINSQKNLDDLLSTSNLTLNKPNLEINLTLWNRKKIWFEINFLTLENNGKFKLLLFKDITARKLREIELIKNEKHFKALFENASDMILIYYLNYGKTFGNFCEINSAVVHKLNYTKEELFSLNPLMLIKGEFENKMSEIIDELYTIGNSIFDVTLITKDGIELPCEVHSKLIDFNERPAVLSIARDTSQREKVQEKLKQTSEQLRNLASRLELIREEERLLIAQEVHDELGQVLTALKIQISLLENKLNKNQTQLKIKSKYISELIDNAISSVQKISSQLRPIILDELGLISAIEWSIKEFSKHTGIDYEIDTHFEEINLEKAKSIAIFRIFQEAITNIARHSNANKVKVTVKIIKNKLNLEIMDNGKGITQAQITNPKSLGILGMKERTIFLGGDFAIKSSMGNGTLVIVEIPITESIK